MQYKNQHLNQSVVVAIRIIRILRRSVHPLRTSDIAQRVNTAYCATYRILLSLESEGIVGRDKGGIRWCEAG